MDESQNQAYRPTAGDHARGGGGEVLVGMGMRGGVTRGEGRGTEDGHGQ